MIYLFVQTFLISRILDPIRPSGLTSALTYMYTACALFVLACVTLCVGQKNYNPLPPQVAFISKGKFTGTFRTGLGTLVTSGSIDYLAGATEYEHRTVILEFGLETTDTWEVETSAQIDTWEVADVVPDTCLHQTFSESDGTYPQCTAWTVNGLGVYFQNCTIFFDAVSVADLSVAVVLNAQNQLVSYNDQIKILGQFVEGETVTMNEQGNSPPSPSDFGRPSLCDQAKPAKKPIIAQNY